MAFLLLLEVSLCGAFNKCCYLTGACLGAGDSPDLYRACVCYRKNLLKEPHALDGPENSCTIHGPFPTSSEPPPKQNRIRTKEEMSFYCRKTETWREKAGGGGSSRWVHSRGSRGPGVSVTELSDHPTGRRWRQGGGQAALAELCAWMATLSTLPPTDTPVGIELVGPIENLQ